MPRGARGAPLGATHRLVLRVAGVTCIRGRPARADLEGQTHLLEGCLIHVLKQLVFLGQLILENVQLGVYLAVLILQSIYVHLCLHVLFVQVLARLQSHRRDLGFGRSCLGCSAGTGLIRGAED